MLIAQVPNDHAYEVAAGADDKEVKPDAVVSDHDEEVVKPGARGTGKQKQTKSRNDADRKAEGATDNEAAATKKQKKGKGEEEQPKEKEDPAAKVISTEVMTKLLADETDVGPVKMHAILMSMASKDFVYPPKGKAKPTYAEMAQQLAEYCGREKKLVNRDKTAGWKLVAASNRNCLALRELGPETMGSLTAAAAPAPAAAKKAKAKTM